MRLFLISSQGKSRGFTNRHVVYRVISLPNLVALSERFRTFEILSSTLQLSLVNELLTSLYVLNCRGQVPLGCEDVYPPETRILIARHPVSLHCMRIFQFYFQLGTDTWFYAKRCFLSLLENMVSGLNQIFPCFSPFFNASRIKKEENTIGKAEREKNIFLLACSQADINETFQYHFSAVATVRLTNNCKTNNR